MEHLKSTLILTLLFLYIIQITRGLEENLNPKSPDNNLISGPQDGSNVESKCVKLADPKAKTFKVVSNSYINSRLRRCINSVEVSGQGILDRFDLKCDNINGEITYIGTDKFLAYDNPSQRLRLFTNTPGTLTIVKDGVCTKRSYTIEKGRTFFKTSKVSKEDCKTTNKDMEEAVKKWQTNFEEEMKKAYPDCYPFCGANEQEAVKDKDEDGGAGNKGDKGGAADNKNGKDNSEEWNF